MVMQVDAKTLGDQVRVSRVSKRWSQAILATIAKVSQGMVSRMERNMPVDEADKTKILKALGINEQ